MRFYFRAENSLLFPFRFKSNGLIEFNCHISYSVMQNVQDNWTESISGNTESKKNGNVGDAPKSFRLSKTQKRLESLPATAVSS